MKELFGQAILIITLLCASVALVGGMTGWIDFGRVIESSPLLPTAARPQPPASNSISAQRPAEQKAPEPKPVIPAPAASATAPQTVEQRAPEHEVTTQAVTVPEVRPPQQANIGNGLRSA